MDYIAIGQEKENVRIDFLNIEDLINIARKYSNLTFRFIDTEFYPKELISWRGSYDLPSITFGDKPIKGFDFEKLLLDGLKKSHTGFKGGEYTYNKWQEPYIAQRGFSSEYKIKGYEVNGCELILITDIDEY